MTPEAVRAVGALLDSFGTLTLATQGPEGPWAAALFFARDEQLNLYFISSGKSRHAREILAAPTVAVTVNGDHRQWKDIRGLQISGTAERLGSKRRARAERLYLRKFEELRRLLAEPATPAESRISSEFKACDFFRIRPNFIRIIDNSKAFGYAEEFVVDDRSSGASAR